MTNQSAYKCNEEAMCVVGMFVGIFLTSAFFSSLSYFKEYVRIVVNEAVFNYLDDADEDVQPLHLGKKRKYEHINTPTEEHTVTATTSQRWYPQRHDFDSEDATTQWKNQGQNHVSATAKQWWYPQEEYITEAEHKKRMYNMRRRNKNRSRNAVPQFTFNVKPQGEHTVFPDDDVEVPTKSPRDENLDSSLDQLIDDGYIDDQEYTQEESHLHEDSDPTDFPRTKEELDAELDVYNDQQQAKRMMESKYMKAHLKPLNPIVVNYNEHGKEI